MHAEAARDLGAVKKELKGVGDERAITFLAECSSRLLKDSKLETSY